MSGAVGLWKFQAFQPHAVGEGRRRWLAYDRVGCVSAREDEGFNVVEVAFHDTSRARKRVPLLNDFNRLSMASLAVKVPSSWHVQRPALPCTIRNNPSTKELCRCLKAKREPLAMVIVVH